MRVPLGSLVACLGGGQQIGRGDDYPLSVRPISEFEAPPRGFVRTHFNHSKDEVEAHGYDLRPRHFWTRGGALFDGLASRAAAVRARRRFSLGKFKGAQGRG